MFFFKREKKKLRTSWCDGVQGLEKISSVMPLSWSMRMSWVFEHLNFSVTGGTRKRKRHRRKKNKSRRQNKTKNTQENKTKKACKITRSLYTESTTNSFPPSDTEIPIKVQSMYITYIHPTHLERSSYTIPGLESAQRPSRAKDLGGWDVEQW